MIIMIVMIAMIIMIIMIIMMIMNVIIVMTIMIIMIIETAQHTVLQSQWILSQRSKIQQPKSSTVHVYT